jgi:hypothetical protein
MSAVNRDKTRLNVPVPPDVDYAPTSDPSLAGLVGGGS